MASVAPIQAASATASGSSAPAGQAVAQTGDAGFMAALDAILQAADGAIAAAAAQSAPVTAAAQPAPETVKDATAPDAADTLKDQAAAADQSSAESLVQSDPADLAAGSQKLPATDQLPVLPAANATAAVAAAPVKTSLLFAQAGVAPPSDEAADAGAASTPVSTTGTAPHPGDPALVSVLAKPQAVAATVVSGPVQAPAATPAPVQNDAAALPQAPSDAAPAPSAAAPSSQKSSKSGAQPDDQATGPVAAQPAPDSSSSAILAAAAAQAQPQAAPAQPSLQPQTSTNRGISPIGQAGNSRMPQPASAPSVLVSASAAQSASGAVKTNVADADAAGAAPASQASVKPDNTAAVNSAASSNQSADDDGAAAPVAAAPAKADPAIAAPVIAADAAPAVDKAKAGGDASSFTAAVKTADAQAVPLTGTTVGTAPVSNAQDASKLVLTSTAVASPADQVSLALHKAVGDKASSVTIALNPAELGKVEVKLDFSRDGSVQASIVAERADTLQMLKSDHQGLQQALTSAGLSTDASSLSFSLGSDRQNSQANQGGNNSPYASRTSFTAESVAETPASATSTRSVAADGRVDMFV